MLFVLECDTVLKEVEDTVADCEGDGLQDRLPLDDGLTETYAEVTGSGGGIHMEFGGKRTCPAWYLVLGWPGP